MIHPSIYPSIYLSICISILEVVLQVVVERHVAANVGQQVRVALLPQHAAQRLAEPARLEELEGRTVEGTLLLLG